MIFYEKKSGKFSLEINHTSDFPQDNHCTWICSRSALCIFPISSHSIKRHTYGPRINKIKYFTVLSTTLLSKAGFFFCDW